MTLDQLRSLLVSTYAGDRLTTQQSQAALLQLVKNQPSFLDLLMQLIDMDPDCIILTSQHQISSNNIPHCLQKRELLKHCQHDQPRHKNSESADERELEYEIAGAAWKQPGGGNQSIPGSSGLTQKASQIDIFNICKSIFSSGLHPLLFRKGFKSRAGLLSLPYQVRLAAGRKLPLLQGNHVLYFTRIQILVQIFAAFRAAFKNNGFFKLAFITLKVDSSSETLHVNTLTCPKLSCAELKLQEWQQLFQLVNQSLGKTENDFIQCRKIDLLQELIKNYKSYQSLQRHIEKVIKYCLFVLSKMKIQEDSIGLLWDIVEEISDDPMLEFYASKLLFSSAKIFDNLLKQIVIRAFQQANKASKQGAKSLLLLCVFSRSIMDREDISGGLLQIISNLQIQGNEFQYKTCALFFIYKFNPLIAKLYGQQRETVASLMLKLIGDLEMRQLPPCLKQLQYCCCHKLLQFGYKNKLLMQSQINQALGRLFAVYDKDFGDNIQKFIQSFINNLQNQMCLVIGLVKHIVNLILQQLVNSQKNQVVINIYWNTLRFIADNPKLIVPAASEIQNCVLPLYQFMSDPKTIQFDEDICLFIGALIKATKRISQPQLKLFTLFPLIFNKYKKTFSFSYPCITLILGYGADVIGRFPEAVNLIIQLAEQNLKESNRIDNIQSIFILQCLVINLHPYLQAESVNAILQVAKNKLNSLNDCNSACVESNLYGLIFLMILPNETKQQMKMKIMNSQLNKQCLTKVSQWPEAKSVTLFALGTYMGQISNVLIIKRILQIILDLSKVAPSAVQDPDDDIFMEYNLSYELYKENRFDKFNEQIAIQRSIKKLFERKVIDRQWLTKSLSDKRFSKLEQIMGVHQTQAGVRRIVSVKK